MQKCKNANIYYLFLIATMPKTKEGDGRKGRRAGLFFLLTIMEVVCYSNAMPRQWKLDVAIVMDRLQTSGEFQDKTSFIDPSIGVDLLKGCSSYYLLV
jgi:hypothetical protein